LSSFVKNKNSDMKDMAYKVETISELHQIAGFSKPKHPLITIIDYSKVDVQNSPESGSFICSFYSVNFKNNCSFVYGKQAFDHQEGTLNTNIDHYSHDLNLSNCS